MTGRISAAPSEQLTPMKSGSACSTEMLKASMVCPERLRPLLSTAVNESQSGSSPPCARKTSSIAISAALAFSVSKIVSTISRSTPPSIRACTCSK